VAALAWACHVRDRKVEEPVAAAAFRQPSKRRGGRNGWQIRN
jgi:hypothetical protein